MRFDSNLAWTEAVARVRSNRDVLMALAGVFFMLPTLLSTVFLTDVQSQIMENVQNPAVAERLVQGSLGRIIAFGFGGALVQVVGYLAIMALLSAHGRPTVGQAIAGGIRALPTLIGVSLAVFFGTMAASMLLTLVIGAVAGRAGTTLAVVLMLALFIYVAVKLSLVVPVVVKEGRRNPFAAIARSWSLTRGNTLRLLGFFVLLTIGYLVIAMLVTIGIAGPVLLVLGQGQVALLVIGLVSGAISAVASVILTAVLAQAHRQLAGPTPEAIADTFE